MKTIRLMGLLLVLLLAMSAVADTIATFNVTLNWDTGTTTFGTFSLKKTPTNITLDSWNIDTPLVGVFNTVNSTGIFAQNVCGAMNPCFTVRFSLIDMTVQDPVLMLSFAGSASSFTGGPLLAGTGSLSYVECVDPCMYFLRNGTTNAPEPSSFILGGVAAFGLLRRKVSG